MTFEEDIKRLEPILGSAQSGRLWRAYLMEDRDGQEDIHRWVRLRLEQKLGHSLLSAGQFLSLPSEDDADGKYFLGNVMQAGKPSYPFGLRNGEMIQHAGIFGRSGAGKTNMVALLLRSLIEQKTPFVIFDWKRNYRDLLAFDGLPLEIYTIGRKTRPLHFNPLIPPVGTPPEVWLKKLIEVACNSFYLGEGVSFLLQDCIDQVYRRFGVYEATAPENYPTMRDVLEEMRQTTAKGRKGMWMDSALRALQTLCFGPISDVINVSRNESLGELLRQHAVLELDALANAEKIFFIESLMIWIHHARMTEKTREVFKHALIIEEAHNILKPTEKDDIINNMLREIREFGEAVILVDQHPSLMSVPAMGNTYCTIALNVKHSRDVQALGDAMQVPLKDRALFGELHVGFAVVKLQSRFTQPFLIHVPKVDIKKGTVTDDDLRDRYRSDSGDSRESGQSETASIDSKPISPDCKTSILTDTEEILLKDIITFPLDSIIKRYSRLHLSRRRGNACKDSLIEKGVLIRVPIPVRAGQVVLLAPSEGMKQALGRKGMIFNSREGGVVHQFWKREIRMVLERSGWTVEAEKSIGNGQQVDLHAERNGKTLAVEVETGSRGILNAEKALNAGYDLVMSFAVNGHAKETMERQIVEKALSSERLILAMPVDYEQAIENMARREMAADRKI